MMTDGASIQERFFADLACFGCGPANVKGLRLRSFPADEGTVDVELHVPGSPTTIQKVGRAGRLELESQFVSSRGHVDVGLHLVDGADLQVVLQVGAHPRRVLHHRHTVLGQGGGLRATQLFGGGSQQLSGSIFNL